MPQAIHSRIKEQPQPTTNVPVREDIGEQGIFKGYVKWSQSSMIC